MSPHIINRVTILGTGLIGGSLGLALRKYTTNICISGWDRSEVVREAQSRGAIDEAFSGELAPALQNADLIYIALPIAATIDFLPEISRHAPVRALVTDACSTKVRVTQAAAAHFSSENGPLFLDRKSTRLNSSHQIISYAVFCLKKKKKSAVPFPSWLP